MNQILIEEILSRALRSLPMRGGEINEKHLPSRGY